MGNLTKYERVFQTKENQMIDRYFYEALDEFGGEVEGMSNQQYTLEGGVYKYSGEIITFREGTEGGGGGDPGGGGGGGGGGTETGNQYAIEISTSQEPIETHPRYSGIDDNFWEMWRIWKSDKTSDLLLEANLKTGLAAYVGNSGHWSPFMYPGSAYELALKYSKGITDYLAPRVISRQILLGTPPSGLNAVGKISSPPFTGGWGGNWILNGVSGRLNSSTGLWETTSEWLGSGPTNWDTDIYS